MKTKWQIASLACFAAILGLVFPANAASQPAVSFSKQVLPIFQAHCVMCHGPGGVGNTSAGLDLSTFHGLKSGSIGGVAVVPYHPERSQLIRFIKTNWDSKAPPNAVRMPPVGDQLSSQDIETIDSWIKQGAKNN